MTRNGRPRVDTTQYSGGEWRDRSEVEPFVQIPQMFLDQMTPEQYRAQQQLYQQAYAKAVQQLINRDQHLFGFGEGI